MQWAALLLFLVSHQMGQSHLFMDCGLQCCGKFTCTSSSDAVMHVITDHSQPPALAHATVNIGINVPIPPWPVGVQQIINLASSDSPPCKKSIKFADKVEKGYVRPTTLQACNLFKSV